MGVVHRRESCKYGVVAEAVLYRPRLTTHGDIGNIGPPRAVPFKHRTAHPFHHGFKMAAVDIDVVAGDLDRLGDGIRYLPVAA